MPERMNIAVEVLSSHRRGEREAGISQADLCGRVIVTEPGAVAAVRWVVGSTSGVWVGDDTTILF